MSGHVVYSVVIAVFVAIYFLVVGDLFGGAGSFVIFVGKHAPTISDDAQILGDLSPTAFTAFIIVFAPNKYAQRGSLLLYILLFTMIYFMYVHFTSFVKDDGIHVLVANDLDSNVVQSDAIVKTVRTAVDGMRVCIAMALAALSGIWLQAIIRGTISKQGRRIFYRD
ncbi:MAG: hypothetical protein P1U37_00650 [Minwuia sp.]|nr:hypothetical protein [Minwuia sp.]